MLTIKKRAKDALSEGTSGKWTERNWEFSAGVIYQANVSLNHQLMSQMQTVCFFHSGSYNCGIGMAHYEEWGSKENIFVKMEEKQTWQIMSGTAQQMPKKWLDITVQSALMIILQCTPAACRFYHVSNSLNKRYFC